MSDKSITTSYANAKRLNQIMFDNYVATFLNSNGRMTIVQDLQEAFNVNQIPMSNLQIEQLQYLSFDSCWEEDFSTCMINFYELREMVPPYSPDPGIIIPVNTPAQLGMCEYIFPFRDGTFDYIELFFKDPNDPVSFFVDPLIIAASTDPRLSQSDRDFIANLIGD